MPAFHISRVIAHLEKGRRPALVSLALSAMLAVLTGVRFLVLVGSLPPNEYGVLNLFTLLATLMPLLMSLGLSLQYQRIAHFQGVKRISSLQRTSLIVTISSVLPSFVVILILSQPIIEVHEWIWASAYIVIIAGTTALSTFSSQIMLGLNFRATASFLMFLANAGATIALIPVSFMGSFGVTEILGWWALFSLGAAIVGFRIVGLQRLRRRKPAQVVSIREGLLSVPSQIGPWLFVFIVRYMIGINAGSEAIANFAIASTVIDMAFLVSVSLLNHFTNRVMAGTQSPLRGMMYSIPFFLALSTFGSFLVAWLLPRLGQDGYHLEFETTLILAGVGITRIYITAWRARALGQKKLHLSSLAYIIVVALSLGIFLVMPVDSLSFYAIITLIGFVVVAAVQRYSLRTS